jgi:transcriptional regulator with XRE-family HTH domain
MVPQKEIGKKIKEVQRLTNVTLKQLADKIGASLSTVANWSTDRTVPNKKVFNKALEVIEELTKSATPMDKIVEKPVVKPVKQTKEKEIVKKENGIRNEELGMRSEELPKPVESPTIDIEALKNKIADLEATIAEKDTQLKSKDAELLLRLEFVKIKEETLRLKEQEIELLKSISKLAVGRQS